MKKKLTIQEEKIKEIISWQDICGRSYDGEHIWAEGQLFRNPDIFGLCLPFIRIIQLKMDICRACGIIRRRS